MTEAENTLDDCFDDAYRLLVKLTSVAYVQKTFAEIEQDTEGHRQHQQAKFRFMRNAIADTMKDLEKAQPKYAS